MSKYYMVHDDLFEVIGDGNAIRCIASTKKRMLGITTYHPILNKPWIQPVDNKKEALFWMKEWAYYDNNVVYELT